MATPHSAKCTLTQGSDDDNNSPVVKMKSKELSARKVRQTIDLDSARDKNYEMMFMSMFTRKLTAQGHKENISSTIPKERNSDLPMDRHPKKVTFNNERKKLRQN